MADIGLPSGVFTRCESVCVHWWLNANSSKTVEAMDFKFGLHASSYSPVMIFKMF